MEYTLYYNVNTNELLSLLKDKTCTALAIQETHLKNEEVFNFRNYSIFRKDYDGGRIACGGVCIMVSDDTPCAEISVNTDLQAVAVQILQPKKVTICSIYLPPASNISEQQLLNLYYQLPEPIILLGDFNSHSPLWFSSDIDSRGRIIEAFLNSSNLGILNENTPTHLCLSTGRQSYIDLTLVSPYLLDRLSWSASDDPYGSDHYPIFIETLIRQPPPRHTPRWKIKDADWDSYQRLAQLTDIDFSTDDIDHLTTEVTDRIITAAEQCIPKTKGRNVKILVPSCI